MAVHVPDPSRAGRGVVDLRSVRDRDAVRSDGDDQRADTRVPAAQVSPRRVVAFGGRRRHGEPMNRPLRSTPRIEFDVILDEWPAGPKGDALHSLVASGDVIAARLPRGFVGVKLLDTRTVFYIEQGQWHLKQIRPTPEVSQPEGGHSVLRLQNLRFRASAGEDHT